MNRRMTAVPIVMALLAAGGSVAAQQTPEREAQRLTATREELEGLLGRLLRQPQQQASTAAAVARYRLVEGDFQPGDGVLLSVEGEPQLSDTFVVGTGRELVLPTDGVVPLRGVLYSELEAYVGLHLRQFLRDPVVRARGLVRLSVTGGVARPGFYLVPADALLSDAVMAAGGLTPEAKLQDLRVERGGAPLIAAPEMRRALAEGRTLDQAGVRSGDQFVVPGGRGTRAVEQIRLVTLLLSVPITIYTLTRIF